MSVETLVVKIRSLTPEKAAEVEDFVDFPLRRCAEQVLLHAATKLSEDALR
ncbi:MAG: hypothetical protein U0166_28285 [Acidobacteriota bacterium]